MMYVPGGDQSMLRGGERPVDILVFRDTQRTLDEGRAIVEREIEILRAILSRPRPSVTRRRDD